MLLENIHRSGLAPCAQGLQFLRSITGPVCVVCVVGPARTGKSYLLSQLQGSSFRLGHTMKAETMGKIVILYGLNTNLSKKVMRNYAIYEFRYICNSCHSQPKYGIL